ncbi:MAG TPA: hypothetical protein VEW45_08915 [Candidatus Dormibacteraeota bacterium]|nr:hypothetical protein [Candidatus Dormibacteraeota bacterium]
MLELLGSPYSHGSPERIVLAEQWDVAADLSGKRIDETNLVRTVSAGLRAAAAQLRRVVTLYGADGLVTQAFAEQAAILANRTTKATAMRSSVRFKKVERARALKAEGLTAGQIAARMTMERNDPQRQPIDERPASALGVDLDAEAEHGEVLAEPVDHALGDGAVDEAALLVRVRPGRRAADTRVELGVDGDLGAPR